MYYIYYLTVPVVHQCRKYEVKIEKKRARKKKHENENRKINQ